jgi:DNA repair protein RadD
MGLEGNDLDVTSWTWRKHISKASGKEMLAVTYYGALSDGPVTEYLAVAHDGYAGEKSRALLADMAHKAGGRLDYNVADLHEIARQMSSGKPPACIEFKLDGKFHRVIKRSWNEHQTTGT